MLKKSTTYGLFVLTLFLVSSFALFYLLKLQNTERTEYYIALTLLAVIALLFYALLRNNIIQKEDKNFLKLIGDSMGEGLYVIDKEGAIRDINKTACELLGYERDELLGKVAHYIFHHHEQNKLSLKECPIYKTVNENLSYSGIEEFKMKDGGLISVEVISKPMIDEGKVIASVTIFKDITEQQKYEKLLKKFNQELSDRVESEVAARMSAERNLKTQEAMLIQQSKLAELGNMMGVIAHQWKQPLNVISLIATMLSELYEDGALDAETMNRNVDIITKQTEFMSQTITDFRNFYKPSKEKELFDISKECEKVINLLTPKLNKESIRLQCNHFEKLSCQGYPGEFKQVILNIVNNAIDELSKKESRDKTIQISVEKMNASALIKISDNGGGIPESIMQNIFEPFISTKGENGTGIGLSLSRTIIEDKMGGALKAQNIDNGAMFIIELPVTISSS